MIIGFSGKLNGGKDQSAEYFDKLTPAYIWDYKRFADELKDTVCRWIGCTREQLEDRVFKETPLGEEWWYYKFEDGSGIYDYLINDELRSIPSVTDGYLVKTTPRLLMQLVGTDCGRDIIHPNIWINALMSQYKEIEYTIKGIMTYMPLYKFPNWIITDTRFPNEVAAIKKRGGVVIRINRPIEQRFPELYTIFANVHNESGEYEFLKWLKYYDNEMWKKLTHESETALDDYNNWDFVVNNDGTLEDLELNIKLIINGLQYINKL